MVDLSLAVTGGTSACNSVDGRCAYTNHGGDAGTYHYSVREGTLYHQTAKYLCIPCGYSISRTAARYESIIIRWSCSGLRRHRGALGDLQFRKDAILHACMSVISVYRDLQCIRLGLTFAI